MLNSECCSSSCCSSAHTSLCLAHHDPAAWLSQASLVLISFVSNACFDFAVKLSRVIELKKKKNLRIVIA